MDAPRTAAALGIDFGTHHTVATVLRADGRRHQLLFDGHPLLPSGIYLDYEASLSVGRDAARDGRRHPERYERNPKLRLGSPSLLLGDQEVGVHDAVGAVIGRVLSECARVAGPPRAVTLTVPAGWGPTRRHAIGDAAASAGAAGLVLLPEPVAAARYFVEVLGHDLPPGRAVVVFDLGAGTFDASVVVGGAEGYEVLAVDGSDRLGGHFLDHTVVDYLGGRFEGGGRAERWHALLRPDAGGEDRRARFALYDEVREAKERLSRSVTTEIPIPGIGADELLTRAELELLARPMLADAVAITKAVLRESGRGADDLAGVFMVGGASRMPLAATMLHRELGVAPTLIEQPELVVSEGAVSMPARGPAPAPAPAPTPPTPAPTPLAAPRRARGGALIAAVVAAALAVLVGGAWFLHAAGGQRAEGTFAAVEPDMPATASASAADAEWASVAVTGVETTASSVSVTTDAPAEFTDCTVTVDGPFGAPSASAVDCARFTVDGLRASSDYELSLQGPPGSGAASALVEQVATTTVTGEVYWDCPQRLHYCRNQGGEPGISPEPRRGLDPLGHGAVGERFELLCHTTGDLVVPRGEDEVDGYHDYHPGKAESDVWVHLALEGGGYGYLPFVWLIVDPGDRDSTADLPEC